MFQNILVPLDRSELSEQALGQAAAIARLSGATIDLALVHQPLPFDGFGDPPWHAEQMKAEEAYLQYIANELSSGSGVPVTCAVVQGPVVDTICKRSWDVDADLIVITSHGRTGLSRLWVGSVADGVIRHSAKPVLMFRPVEGKVARLEAHQLIKHVLVPLDGSPFAADALSSAAALAGVIGARITLLRVVMPVPLVTIDAGLPFVYPYPIAAPDDAATAGLVDVAKAEMTKTVRQLAEQGVSNVATEVVVAGQVAPEIIGFAHSHDADLIAMSTHGRGMSRLFIGSVADKIIRASKLPVLVHRPLSIPAMHGSPETLVDAQLPALAPA